MRINVTGTKHKNEFGEPVTGVIGWFDLDKAEPFHEEKRWDGSNKISVATGNEFDHERLFRTAQGRWVLHAYSRWEKVPDSYSYVTADQAREWLISQNHDQAVEDHFGELDEERGPGQPEIGGYINVPLGEELRDKIDAWRGQMSRNEAIREAVRRLIG